jgi:hypothetical protein
MARRARTAGKVASSRILMHSNYVNDLADPDSRISAAPFQVHVLTT